MSALVITLVGPDKPGLVGTVSNVVREHDGNWLESRMSHLAGQFAGIVLVDVPQAEATKLVSDLEQLQEQGLKIIVEVDSGTAVAAEGKVWTANTVGNDRPGIVREITQTLSTHNVNVEELTTNCEDAPQGGGQIFRASARVRLPDDLSIDVLQVELENIATDLMIDVVADGE